MQKTRERRQSFVPMVVTTATSARWDAFATDCVGWMVARAEAGVRSRATSAEGRLLAIFDVFDDWIDGRDTEAASVVDAIVKLNERHPLGRIVSRHGGRIRAAVIDLGRQAGLVDVEEFAESWHILLRGTALKASEGDTGAPARAQDMGRDLIARHRPRPVVEQFSFDEVESEFGWVEATDRAGSAARRSDVRFSPNDDLDWFGFDGWSGQPGSVTLTA